MNSLVLRTVICGAVGMATLAQNRAIADPYLLDTGDEVRIVAPDRPELSGKFTISPDGEVAAPALEGLKLSGQSVHDAAEAARAKLEKKFGAVSVALEVTKYRPFYILGDVGAPGTYSWQPDLTLAKAVAIAGGYRRANEGFQATVAAVRATESYATEARQLGEALIERARYVAELAGKDSFAVDQHAAANVGSTGEFQPRQLELLRSRLSALRTEKENLTQQQDTQNKEITALQSRGAAHDKIAAELDEEIASLRPLVAKGVVSTSRLGELDREQNHIQSDALQTAVLLNQARTTKTQTELQLYSLDRDHSEGLLVSLNQVDQRIDQLENQMAADKAVVQEAGVSVDVERELVPSFQIDRKGKSPVTSTGDENEAVMAGDVIHVRRVLETPRVAR